jgi:hypothetical protein
VIRGFPHFLIVFLRFVRRRRRRCVVGREYKVDVGFHGRLDNFFLPQLLGCKMISE